MYVLFSMDDIPSEAPYVFIADDTFVLELEFLDIPNQCNVNLIIILITYTCSACGVRKYFNFFNRTHFSFYNNPGKDVLLFFHYAEEGSGWW